MNNQHEGHRKRVRKRFLEHGLSGFSDCSVLEFVIYFSVGRKDTSKIAHGLLDRFHTLPEVLEAKREELMSVPGVGENTAVLLSLIPELCKRYLEQASLPRTGITSPEDAAGLMKARFMYEPHELTYALFLDNAGGIISCELISEGVVNATEVSVRSLIERTVDNNAASVILAHNHPHGYPEPSDSDISATFAIKSAFDIVGVKMLDHLIVAGDKCYSIFKKRLM